MWTRRPANPHPNKESPMALSAVSNGVDGLPPQTKSLYEQYLGIAEQFNELSNMGDSRELNQGEIIEPSVIPIIPMQRNAYSERVEKIDAILQAIKQ